MATINFAGNTYAGEVLEDLLVYTAKGNETYEAGLVHVKPGIQKRYVLPHIQLGSIIQDNKPTPTSTEGAANDETGFNQYKLSERYLDPQDFMIYLEFNPRDFEEYWRFAQPEGPLVFRELDPAVQKTMLRLLLDRKDQYVNDCIWCGKKGGDDSTIDAPVGGTKLGGDSAAGKMKYFDGALARVMANLKAQDAVDKSSGVTEAIKNEVASGRVVLAGATEFTTGKDVEDALYTIWKKTPANVRKSKKLAEIFTDESISRKMTGNRSIPSCKYWTWSWTKSDIGILKNTSCPAVLTENGFMDCKEECDYLLSEKGKQDFVDLHVAAIEKYIKSL